jgi:putative ABC transport system substrate-binding protein
VWPLAARAQQDGSVRRIGVLIARAAADPEATEGVGAFAQGLAELGWTIGRNVRIEYRYGGGDPETFHKYAKELVELAPDVVLTSGTPSVAALQQASRSIPIVFTLVTDPVGAGFVDSLAKRDPINPAGVAQFSTIQTVASSIGVEVSPINVRDASEIERAIAAFARSANGGLVVTGSASATTHRELIIALAARHKLPAVYSGRFNVAIGGLISYGPNRVEQFRRAAGYVDRILKGEKPADLPVQAPTSYELIVNLKTAKALGLTVPQTLLASATEVIE